MRLAQPFRAASGIPEPRVNAAKVFDCAMCGHCCEGKGGIILGPKDLPRIAAYFQLSEDDFAARYAELHNGKLKIKNGTDGFCIFFKAGTGCGVHVAKPDVCRAWPFFRGNIVDPESFALAKDYCPGINPCASHADFAAEGRRLLTENGLLAHDSSNCGHALILCAITKPAATAGEPCERPEKSGPAGAARSLTRLSASGVTADMTLTGKPA